MRLACPSCGTRYDSPDEPAPGRVYSIRCRCGKRIMVAGTAPSAPPGPRYDPYAAGHGLLIDEAQARALAGARPVLEAPVEAAAPDEVEVTVTFSKALAPKVPEGNPGEDRAARPAPLPVPVVPPAWIVPAVALVAFLVAGVTAAGFLIPTDGVVAAALAEPAPVAPAEEPAGVSPPLPSGQAATSAAAAPIPPSRPDAPSAGPARSPRRSLRSRAAAPAGSRRRAGG